MATTPSAPRAVTVTVADGKATVSWTAPASDGGSPITGYEVTAQPGGQVCHTLTRSCTVTGLTPGVSYTFSVVAINTADGRNGTGRSSAAVSSAVVITAPPTAPGGLSVTPGDRILTLTFDPPTNNGGSAVTAYQATTDGGTTWKKLATTASGSRLSGKVVAVLNGTTYQVAVRAVNANGTGPATASVESTPPVWFSDQVSAADRAAEIPVPKKPTAYKGPLKHTTAYARSKNGTVSIQASLLDGRQLQQEQAVEIKGKYFVAKKTTLSSTGKKEVKAMAASLTYVNAVTCEGYAGYGGDDSHAAKYSTARAVEVCALIKKYATGVTSRKTVGYAAAYPQVVGGKSANRDVNRRVVVLIRS